MGCPPDGYEGNVFVVVVVVVVGYDGCPPDGYVGNVFVVVVVGCPPDGYVGKLFVGYAGVVGYFAVTLTAGFAGFGIAI